MIELFSFPHELLHTIGTFFTAKDLASFVRTSKAAEKTKKVFLEGRGDLVSLFLKKHDFDLSKIGTKALKELKEIGPTIKSLDLSVTFTSGVLQMPLQPLTTIFPKLQTLDLSGCGILRDKDFEEIEKFQELRSLSVMSCFKMTDKGLISVMKLRGLVHLNISRLTYVTAKSLTLISNLPCLQHLDMSHTTNVDDRVVKEIAKLKLLEYLDLSSCSKITDHAIKDLVIKDLAQKKWRF